MDTFTDLDLTVPRSCWSCHKKKVKCDRQQPCSVCARSGARCAYPELDQRKKSRRIPVNALLSRLAQLEKKVSSLSSAPDQIGIAAATGASNGSNKGASNMPVTGASQQATQPVTSNGDAGFLLNQGGESRYIGDSFMADLAREAKDMIIEESPATTGIENTLTSASSPSNEFRSSKTIKTLYSDPKSAWRALRLWQIYKSNIEPMMKILHIPSLQEQIHATMQQPHTAQPTQIMLLNSICFAAMISLDDEESQAIFNLDRGTLMQQYRDETESYIGKLNLMTAPNLEYLQALTIFISTLRAIDKTRAVWILTGLASRIAQSLGIHMDGKAFNLSPFDSELRRRVWWHIFLLEIRAAEDHGLLVSDISKSKYPPSYPSNINDEDIWPGMTEPPKPSTGSTSTTLTLIRIQLADKMIHLGLYPIQAADRSSLLKQITESRQNIKAAYDKITSEWMSTAEQEQENYYIPAMKLLDFSFKKSEFLILFRAYQSSLLDDPSKEEIRGSAVVSALALVESLNRIQDDTSLKRYHWYSKSNPQWFTVGFLLQQLYQGLIRDLQTRQRVQTAIEEIFAIEANAGGNSIVQRQGAIWVALQLLKDKTFAKYSPEPQTTSRDSSMIGTGSEFLTPDSTDIEGLDNIFDFNSFDFSQIGPLDLSLFDSQFGMDTTG